MFRRGANRSSLDALSKVFSRFSANATSTSSFKTNASSSSPLVKMMLMQQIQKKELALGLWLLLLLLLLPLARATISINKSIPLIIIRQKRRERGRSEEVCQARRRKNCLRRLARRPLIKYENQRKEKRQARLENRSLRTLSSKDSQWSNLYQKSGSKSTRTGPDDKRTVSENFTGRTDRGKSACGEHEGEKGEVGTLEQYQPASVETNEEDNVKTTNRKLREFLFLVVKERKEKRRGGSRGRREKRSGRCAQRRKTQLKRHSKMRTCIEDLVNRGQLRVVIVVVVRRKRKITLTITAREEVWNTRWLGTVPWRIMH